MRGRFQRPQVWASQLTVSVLLHFAAATVLAGFLLKLLVRQHFRAFIFLLVLTGMLLPGLNAAAN